MDSPSEELFGHPPRIDELAPDFSARSTLGEVQLSEFRGKWLILFSHPADFTPVCTSEFVALEKASESFKNLNCQLLGLSVDSLYAHIAWVKDIKRNFDVHISFPIIEDVSMSISRAYGMIHDNSTSTAAVRTCFFIDPHGYIRAVIHYPMNVGRSVSELLRVLEALQFTDECQLATPEGWNSGDDAVLLPPSHQEEADNRTQSAEGSWYFTPVESKR